jgi:hypothetical protein
MNRVRFGLTADAGPRPNRDVLMGKCNDCSDV